MSDEDGAKRFYENSGEALAPWDDIGENRRREWRRRYERAKRAADRTMARIRQEGLSEAR